jgi:hypothetical protein
MPPDTKSLAELLSHERFAITHPDDFTRLDPLNLRRVGIRDLSAPDDGYPKHDANSLYSFENIA